MKTLEVVSTVAITEKKTIYKAKHADIPVPQGHLQIKLRVILIILPVF